MKKYFPIFMITFLLGGFMLHQFVSTGFDATKATISNKDKDKKSYYESLFTKLKLKEFNGKKREFNLKTEVAPIVILNFWASWCTPCLEEFPSIVEMKKKFTDKEVLLLGINNDDDKKALVNIKKTIEKFKFNFPVVRDSEGELAEKFLISGIPVSIIYHKGKVVEISNGAKDFNSTEVIESFKKLLSKK